MSENEYVEETEREISITERMLIDTATSMYQEYIDAKRHKEHLGNELQDLNNKICKYQLELSELASVAQKLEIDLKICVAELNGPRLVKLSEKLSKLITLP